MISLGITLSPVHMMSISGASLVPMVFRYSDVAILRIKYNLTNQDPSLLGWLKLSYRRNGPSSAVLGGTEEELGLPQVLVNLISDGHLGCSK